MRRTPGQGALERSSEQAPGNESAPRPASGPEPGPASGPAPGPEPGPDDVDALLDLAVGRLGGARRDGQHAMARAVAQAVATQGHLLVQAGTGTGKSLGYLVPAVAHAVAAQERVVVSTATLALQRQVCHRDLPLVVEALAPRLDRPPEVSLLKGWANYLCRHKVAGGYPQDEGATLFTLPGDPAEPGAAGEDSGAPGAALGAEIVRLREWAETTTSGDRDDLVPGVSERAWRQVSVSAMECLGGACPHRAECFPVAAREAAAAADVVVTNHAMLGIAATGSPGVLPEYSAVVVDEAHELVDRVTAQATVELSAGSVDSAARLARRRAGVPAPDLEAAATALAAALRDLPEGRLAGGLPPRVREAVGAVAREARTVLTALRPERPAGGQAGPGGATATPGAGQSRAQAGVKVASAAVLALFETAERIGAQDTSADVLWCERPGAGGGGRDDVRLRAAPLDVSTLVGTRLLAGRAAVLTSATLTLGGGFEPLARAAGLADPGETPPREPWRGLDVGSPFDYRRQGILYVARALPPPGRDGLGATHLDEIAQLVTAAGGATLGLFSSRRAAVAAAEALRARLGVPVLCQGEDRLPTLVREFAADESTCLFGTLSLWQGVDVPGRACRLVLIDRIPFPRPDDPIRSARAEAVDRAGGNGFMAVSAAHAALLLAQGAGRLIRTTADRGVVAVLDSRLATARYAGFLLRSMPAMWRTTDPAVARAALRRLAAGAGPTPTSE